MNDPVHLILQSFGLIVLIWASLLWLHQLTKRRK